VLAVTVPLVLLSWIRSFKELFFFTATGVIALVTAILIILADGMKNTTEEVVERTPLFLSLNSTLHFLGPATFCYTIHYCVLAIGAECLVCVKNEKISYSPVYGGDGDTMADVRCSAKNENENRIELVAYNKVESNDEDNSENGNENGNRIEINGENDGKVQMNVIRIEECCGLPGDDVCDEDGQVVTRNEAIINTDNSSDKNREINRLCSRDISNEINKEYIVEKNVIISRAASREKNNKDQNKDNTKDKNINKDKHNDKDEKNKYKNSNKNESKIDSIEVDEDSVQILFNIQYPEESIQHTDTERSERREILSVISDISSPLSVAYVLTSFLNIVLGAAGYAFYRESKKIM
jgi:Transmembrane amino acid transporter protein